MEMVGVVTVRIVAQIVVRSVVGEVAKSATHDCYNFVKRELKPVHRVKKLKPIHKCKKLVGLSKSKSAV